MQDDADPLPMTEDRMRELVARAGTLPSFTYFLDPYTGGKFFQIARSQGLAAGCEGGMEEAERAVYACWKEGYEPGEWPVRVARFTWSPLAGVPGHRDFLGAVLGLGIEREQIGDIRLGECQAWIAVHEKIASYLSAQLDKAGRVAVRAADAEGEAPPAARGRERGIHPQSMRLDAIVAAAMDMSRAKAQELVRSGRIQLNWREETRTDAETRAGDMVTARGIGRVKILEIGGQSRKGRLFVTVECFLGSK